MGGYCLLTCWLLPTEPINVAQDPHYHVEVLDNPINPADAWVHSGFWKSALGIYKELK